MLNILTKIKPSKLEDKGKIQWGTNYGRRGAHGWAQVKKFGLALCSSKNNCLFTMQYVRPFIFDFAQYELTHTNISNNAQECCVL